MQGQRETQDKRKLDRDNKIKKITDSESKG